MTILAMQLQEEFCRIKNNYYLCIMKKFFSKIWAKVLEFWYLTVRNTVQKRIEVGGFEIVFRQYDLRIRSLSDNFSMKIRSGEHAFGYLAASMGQGHEDNVHGYAVFMYLIATNICRDDRLRRELQRAIQGYQERENAKVKLEEADGNEEAALESVRKDLERSEMSRAQRRRAEKAFQKEAKKILKEEHE